MTVNERVRRFVMSLDADQRGQLAQLLVEAPMALSDRPGMNRILQEANGRQVQFREEAGGRLELTG